MSVQDTIVALSTPPVMAALGVLRLSGPDAFAILCKLFDKPLSRTPAPFVRHGHILDGDTAVDEVVVTFYAAPHSYTGEDTAEISCHGSVYVENRILELCVAHGARLATRGEFTKRAFAAGKLDLVEAESVIDLIESETGAEANAALQGLEGSLSAEICEVRDALVYLSAQLLASIDYPDEDIDDVTPDHLYQTLNDAYGRVTALAASYGRGKLIKSGVRTVLCGRPNAGKSTLMNRLCGAERSIVTSIAGTTRDVVEQSAVFGGMKLLLADTAGLHASDDPVEKIGVSRAYAEVENADLVLYVHDASEPLSVPDEVLRAHAKKLLVVNKCDVCKAEITVPSGFDAAVFVSARTGEGFDALEKSLRDLFPTLHVGGQVVLNARQFACLDRGAKALREALDNIHMTPDALLCDVQDAVSALGEMTGQSVSTAVTDTIFSRFCVGK